MNLRRPTLALFVTAQLFLACSVDSGATDPDPGAAGAAGSGSGGDSGFGGSGTAGGANAAGYAGMAGGGGSAGGAGMAGAAGYAGNPGAAGSAGSSTGGQPPTAKGLPLAPQAQVKDAIARPLTDFGSYSGAGTNSAYFGSAMVVLATASFSGNTSADARLLQQLRYNIKSGHDPSGAGGYVAQHELRFAVAAALAKLTPRIWKQFTVAEKTKIELCMKGLVVGAAYTSSINNFEIKKNVSNINNLRGAQMWWKGAPNFRLAPPATMIAGSVFMGSAGAVTAFLNGFDQAAFAAQLKSNGLDNQYATFHSAGSNGSRPTPAQVKQGITNWKWAINSEGINKPGKLMTDIAYGAFNKKITAGLNGGAGIVVKGVARGRIINGASGLPNKGAMGMANELDTVDGGGKRSAMSYSFKGTRVMLDALTAFVCGGLSGADTKGIVSRVNIGMTDLKYKSVHGYYSYSKGGSGSNNEDWTAALREQQWAWGYTFGHWFDVLAPYLKTQ